MGWEYWGRGGGRQGGGRVEVVGIKGVGVGASKG